VVDYKEKNARGNAQSTSSLMHPKNL